MEGFLTLSHLPKFTPKQSLLLGSSRRGWEHFRFNAVQCVGLYTQHSPGTDLQELGQWCQCLENLQQPKFWRTFLCSRGFLEIIPQTNVSPPPISFLLYMLCCLAPFKSGCSLRSQSHLPKIISGSFPPLFLSPWYYRSLNGLPATITSSPQPPDVLECVFWGTSVRKGFPMQFTSLTMWPLNDTWNLIVNLLFHMHFIMIH